MVPLGNAALGSIRRARDRQRRFRSRCGSRGRAGGSEGGARDQGLDPGQQLLEGAGRDPGGVRRRRLARAARRGRDALVARDRESTTGRDAHRRGAVGDPLARGARRAFTRENGGYRLARCGGASRKRLLQVGDRTGHAITKALREALEAGGGTSFPNHALARSSRPATAGARPSSSRTASCRRSTPAPSCSRPAGAASRRPSARRALDESPERDRRGDRGSRSSSAPRRATSMRCSTTRTAAPGRRPCRATRSPRRHARTAPCSSTPSGEEFTDSLGPRDAVSQAIFDEVAAGRGVETEDGRPAV